MVKLLYFLYDYIVIPLLIAAFYTASLFNEKIKRGINDRKNSFSRLKEDIKKFNGEAKTIWFHSSSLGEFEQAKPIIERLKKDFDVNIAVSFFSPSGYRNSKNYGYADLITYIPLDTNKRCCRFLETLKPDLAVFMRYDIWPNMIKTLHLKGIPSFIVDATLRSDSKRKHPFAESFHKNMYRQINKILTVSDEDSDNFLDFKLNPENVEAVGDTRFDRVHQKSLQAKERKLFKDGFFYNKKVIVLGSSWEADEEVVFPAMIRLMNNDPAVICIIAPHEPTVLRLEKLENKLQKYFSTIRFSYLNNYNNERIILIDSIGILLSLYFYADIAYVGGSFKQGIHNVLEPAVYGVPVLFGPRVQNSREALQLVEKGSGIIVNNQKQAYRKLKELTGNEEHRKKLGAVSYDYVHSNTGATGKIINEITNTLKMN